LTLVKFRKAHAVIFSRSRSREALMTGLAARKAEDTHFMKVMYANKYFFRNGGSEVVMFDEMALMHSIGVDVVHFAMADARNLPSPYSSHFVLPKDYRSQSVVSALHSASSFIHSREAVAKISALIAAERPDLLHCHNIYHQLTPSIIPAAARLGVPVVLTLHDLKTVCPVYTQIRNGLPCTECSPTRFENVLRHKCGGYSLPRRMLLWAEARYHHAADSYRRVTKFIAPSRFMRDAVSARFGAGSIEYIPNGIDVSGIQPIDGDDGYVLYFGRIAADKGVETLLQAHAEDGGAWPLVLAGSGPRLDEYRARYPNAQFTGFLGGDALRARIAKAALVVTPSEVQENCSLSIIEAMAHSKPMVASRIGGVPELVRDGKTGFLCRPKDRRDFSARIRHLLQDSQLRTLFGRAGRKVIEDEYSTADHGRALLALYSSVVNQRDRIADVQPAIHSRPTAGMPSSAG
jgi:glycosyltransferase involved in cell wall biosynthesis